MNIVILSIIKKPKPLLYIYIYHTLHIIVCSVKIHSLKYRQEMLRSNIVLLLKPFCFIFDFGCCGYRQSPQVSKLSKAFPPFSWRTRDIWFKTSQEMTQCCGKTTTHFS